MIFIAQRYSIMRLRVLCLTACTLGLSSLAVPSYADIYGWWKLDEGLGNIAKDSGPRKQDGEIFRSTTGGLGPNRSVWATDPERGTVLGVRTAGVEAGEIPVMTLDQDFTWAFWARQDVSQATPSNVIILGNRYGPNGADTSPREFIKFTPNRFEYHMNAGVALETNPDGTQQFLDDLQYLDCDFCPERHIPSDPSVWIHHAVVKDGATLTYYRDGEFGNTKQIETEQMSPDPLPFYMGGQNGVETWIGYLSDVRLWDNALTQDEIIAAMAGGGGAAPGDFDGNGQLTVADVNLLLAEVKSAMNTKKYDLNSDNLVNDADINVWAKDLKKTWIGDANLDGEFNSGDLVGTFTIGKYETGQPAAWDEGDWTGVFDSGDFVAAFTDGGYEQGPRAAVSAVPEPSGLGLLLCALMGVMRRRRWHS